MYVPKINFLMYCIQWLSVLLVLQVLIPVFHQYSTSITCQYSTSITCQYSTSITCQYSTSITGIILVSSTSISGIICQHSTSITCQYSTSITGIIPVSSTSISGIAGQYSTSITGIISVSSTSISGIACQYSTSIIGIIPVLHSSIALVLILLYWYSLPVLHQYCWSQHLRTYFVSQHTEFDSSLHVHRGLYRIFPPGGKLDWGRQLKAWYCIHIYMFSVHESWLATKDL